MGSTPPLGENAWRVRRSCGAHLGWYCPQQTNVLETRRCGKEVLVEKSLENNQTTCVVTSGGRSDRLTAPLR